MTYIQALLKQEIAIAPPRANLGYIPPRVRCSALAHTAIRICFLPLPNFPRGKRSPNATTNSPSATCATRAAKTSLQKTQKGKRHPPSPGLALSVCPIPHSAIRTPHSSDPGPSTRRLQDLHHFLRTVMHRTVDLLPQHAARDLVAPPEFDGHRTALGEFLPSEHLGFELAARDFARFFSHQLRAQRRQRELFQFHVVGQPEFGRKVRSLRRVLHQPLAAPIDSNLALHDDLVGRLFSQTNRRRHLHTAEFVRYLFFPHDSGPNGKAAPRCVLRMINQRQIIGRCRRDVARRQRPLRTGPAPRLAAAAGETEQANPCSPFHPRLIHDRHSRACRSSLSAGPHLFLLYFAVHAVAFLIGDFGVLRLDRFFLFLRERRVGNDGLRVAAAEEVCREDDEGNGKLSQ